MHNWADADECAIPLNTQKSLTSLTVLSIIHYSQFTIHFPSLPLFHLSFTLLSPSLTLLLPSFPMLKITSLQKSFGPKMAVNIESYTIPQGQMLGLVGNNGAGKSTLFRLILDLIRPDQGTVEQGPTPDQMVDVSTTERWKDWTAAYVDDSFLIDYLTPQEYFHFLARISGVSESDMDRRIEHYHAFLTEEITAQPRLIRHLSAGNKQKVGIVAALAMEPQLLILDEPFNFLDPSSQSLIKHLLQQYNQRTGATILLSSHNLNHTVDICPRIALLEHGVIIRDIDNTDGSAQKELESYFEVRE